MSSCKKCGHALSATDQLNCSSCNGSYHYSCVSYTKENFSKMAQKAKAVWKCPVCKAPAKKSDNTPVKEGDLVDPGLSLEKRLSLLESSIAEKIESVIETSLVKHLKSELQSIRKDLNILPELQKSVEFMSAEFDTLNKEVSSLRSEAAELRAHNRKLQDNISELNVKVCQFEQQARECNVELQCVPEHSKENLVPTVLQLCSVVACPMEDLDILACSRVGKSGRDSARPRTVIIRLRSPRKRDELLAACLKYNKDNPKAKLNSTLLGLGDEKQDIYLGEHLSPSNRKLHAEARLFKKNNKFKYVWVRNGRIYLRKDDNMPAIWVKSEETLSSLNKDDLKDD